jgi:hypothetical protein
MNHYITNHRAHIKLWSYNAVGFLLGCYLGFLIIRDNPFFLLISISLPLGLILFTNPKIGLFIIMFSVFFVDWFMQLGLLSPHMTLLPEAALFFLTIRVVIVNMSEQKFTKTFIYIPIFLFILLGLLSTIINSQHIGTAIVGFRLDLKYVLMFFLIINLNPDEQFFKRMIRIIMVLLLIQIPVALVKLKSYGQGEWAIGTYAGHGGYPSTILPLVAISIFLGFFIFEKPHVRYIVYSLLFFVFSIVGGKRAFVFFLALLIPFLFYKSGIKNLARLYIIAPLIIVGILACIFFVPTLSPAFKNPGHLLDYTVSYTTAHNRETGKAIGRTSALIAAYNLSKKNPVKFLLGFGPGCLTPSYFKEFEGTLRNVFPISYGYSQWVTMSLEYGWGGTLLFLLAFIPLFRVNRRFYCSTSDVYWKAISFGFKGILFTYLMGFFYGVIFRIDLLAFIFWFFSATIFCLSKQESVEVGKLQ